MLCGFILLLVGSVIMSDWQSIGGDPCVPLGELGVESRVRFSGGVTVDRLRCGEVVIGEDTRGYLLETSTNAVPSQCLQHLPPMDDNSTIMCSLSSSTGTTSIGHSTNLYNCYWPSGSIALIMELYHYKTVFNNSLQSLYNDDNMECSNPVSCSCTRYHGCDYMLLTIEPASIEMFETFDNHRANRFLADASKELESCRDRNTTINSQCVCESFNTTLGYECFWNPQSRVTGQYCPRCLEACRGVSRSTLCRRSLDCL